MLDGWGIRNRILLLAALSPALVAIIAGGYLISHRIQHINHTWSSLGQGIAEQLAPVSEYAIASRDHAMLENLAQVTLGRPEIREVMIRDTSGNVMVRAAREAPSSATLPWLEGLLVDHTEIQNRRFVAALGMTTPLQLTPGQAGQLGQIELQISPAAMHAEQLRVGITGGLLLLLALLASIVLGLRIARGISDPVLRLATTVRALREGRLSRRASEKSGGELGSLEQDINAMADAMQSARRSLHSQIDQATADLRTTLEELEIKHAELDLARRRAVQANRGKSGFIARMSHEIRTPVNGIVGFTRLLEQTPLNAEQSQYTRIISSSAGSLLHIINDILDFSRVEADRIVLDNRPFSLHALIEDCLGMLAPQAWEKQLLLTPMIYREVPDQLRGDPVRLRQILTNLVANAIKFTHSGQICVRVMTEGGTDGTVTLTVNVTDTGTGIDPADRQRIFGAFTQADDSITREFGGAGLGLFICERLVRAMAGEIGFDSQPGEGSRFWFSVPLKQTGMTSAGQATCLKALRVALYSPSRLANLARRHALEDQGAEVISLPNLPTCGQRPQYDLCLLELTAPACGEKQTLQALRELRSANVPVLALIHTTDQALQQLLYDSGASLCLTALAPREQWTRCLGKLHLDPRQNLRTISYDERPGPSATGAKRALTALHILIVDDNAINRSLSALMLQRHGALTDEAEDGHRALALCSATRYDCILMDIHMPGLGGAETAARLLADHSQGQSVPVLALTADTLAPQREALNQAGIRECLIKPVEEKTLVERVLACCGRKPGPTSDIKPTAAVDGVTPEMLQNDLKQHLGGLSSAFADEDLEQARHHIHRLHGTAAFCHLEALCMACSRLETLLRGEGFTNPETESIRARVAREVANCIEQTQLDS